MYGTKLLKLFLNNLKPKTSSLPLAPHLIPSIRFNIYSSWWTVELGEESQFEAIFIMKQFATRASNQLASVFVRSFASGPRVGEKKRE